MLPVDNNDRAVRLVAWDELYSDPYQIDRSGKIHTIKRSTSYLTEISASLLKLGHKVPNDSDEWNSLYQSQHKGKIYGDAEISLENTLYNDSQENRFSTWTPCPITFDGVGRVVPAVLSRDEDRDCKLLVQAKESVATDIPIRYYDESTQSIQTYTASHYTPTIHIDSISASTWSATFGDVDSVMGNRSISISQNTFYDDHYRELVDQTVKGRLQTVWMRLSLADVAEHLAHVGSRVFLQELNGWYTLYSIVDFDATLGERALTKVELLESTPPQFKSRSLPRLNPWPSSFEPWGVDNPSDPIRWINASAGGHVLGPSGGIAIGPSNHPGGTRTLIIGSGNTVYGGNNFILGDGNVLGAGVSGTTILGGNNITAYTSNTIFLDGFGTMSPSGSTFYSGITFSNTGLTVGGVTITSTGITFSDGTIFSGGSIYSAGDNIVITGSEISVIPAPTLRNLVITGDTDTLLGGSIYAGLNNQIPSLESGEVLVSAILSSADSVLTGATSLSTIISSIESSIIDGGGSAIIASTNSTINGRVGAVILGGSALTADKDNTVFAQAIDAQEYYLNGVPLTLTGGSGSAMLITPGFNIVSGGTDDNPVISTVTDPVFVNLFLSGSTDYLLGGNLIGGFNTYYPSLVDGSTVLSVALNGDGNSFAGSNYASTFIGGAGNNLIDSYNSAIIASESCTVEARNAAVIAAGLNIHADKDYCLFSNAVDAKYYYLDGELLSLGSGSTLPSAVDGDYLYYSGGTGWIGKNLPIVSTVGGPFHRGYIALNSLVSVDFSGSSGTIGAAMLGGASNQVYSVNWSSSAFVGGSSNRISGSTQGSVFLGGFGNLMTDETSSVINGGDQNTLFAGAYNLVAATNRGSILNSQNTALIAGEFNVISGGTTKFSSIIAGRNNTINSGLKYSAIIAASGITATDELTLYVQNLNVAGTITGGAFSGGGGTPTYVQPGANTQTGGTPSAPIVSVVSSPSFTNVTATVFTSGTTELSRLFEPTIRKLVMSADTLRTGTPPQTIPELTFSGSPNAVYECRYNGRLLPNSGASAVILGMSVPAGSAYSFTSLGGLTNNLLGRSGTHNGAQQYGAVTYAAGSGNTAQDAGWTITAVVQMGATGGTVGATFGSLTSLGNTIRAKSIGVITRLV